MQACDVEAKCLEGLKWRLGPFFAEGWPYCDEYDYGDARDVDELAVSMYR